MPLKEQAWCRPNRPTRQQHQSRYTVATKVQMCQVSPTACTLRPGPLLLGLVSTLACPHLNCCPTPLLPVLTCSLSPMRVAVWLMRDTLASTSRMPSLMRSLTRSSARTSACLHAQRQVQAQAQVQADLPARAWAWARARAWAWAQTQVQVYMQGQAQVHAGTTSKQVQAHLQAQARRRCRQGPGQTGPAMA